MKPSKNMFTPLRSHRVSALPALLASTFLLLVGFTVTWPTPALARGAAVAVGKYEDWNDLDEAEIVQVFRVADYQSVALASIETKGAELPDKGDNTYEPTLRVLASLNENVAAGLKAKAPRGLSVTPGKGGPGALVVRSRVTFLLPGSAAARTFGGLAGKIAGAARLGLAGEVVDGRTNKVLLRFRTKRSSGSGGGLFSGDYTQLMNRSAKEIGEDLGNALGAFK